MYKKLLILFLSLAFSYNLVFASGWHTANEIYPGSFQFGDFNFTGILDINKSGGQIKLTGGSTDAGIFTDNSDRLYLVDDFSASKGIVINMSSGNVGIGTSSPAHKLDLGTSGGDISLGRYSGITENSKVYIGLDGNSGSWADNQGTGHIYFKRVTPGADNEIGFVTYSSTGGGNTVRMLINKEGNVGIDTTSPQSKLHINVADNENTRDNGWDGAIEIQPTTTTTYPAIIFGNQGTSQYSAILWTNSSSGNNGNQIYGGIHLTPTTETNGDLIFRTNNAVGTSVASEKMRILGNGNVGIGQTSPSTMLHVGGGTTTVDAPEGALTIQSGNGAGGQRSFKLYTSKTNYNFHIKDTGMGTDALSVQYNTGNVGIGTTGPNSKLEVAGTIHSTTGGIKFPDNTIQTTASSPSSIFTLCTDTSSSTACDAAESNGGTGTSTYRALNCIATSYGYLAASHLKYTGTNWQFYSGAWYNCNGNVLVAKIS